MTIGITTTKESLHDRSYPGRALKPALVSARPRACFSFVGGELRHRLWRRRDKPLSIAKKRERQSHCLGSLANVRFPSERGTSKRDEN
jgi:hypothetical protein